MKKLSTKKPTQTVLSAWDDVYWMNRIQILITKHSTEPRKSGQFKGHASTNATGWVNDLAKEVQAFIRKHNKGRAYDENMAIAAYMGRAMVVWYCLVHTAKSFDPNRPLSRIEAYRQVRTYRSLLMDATTDGEKMAAVFSGQFWNLPFGKNAHGGDFI
jgi:hypothetical protein